MYITALAKIFW